MKRSWIAVTALAFVLQLAAAVRAEGDSDRWGWGIGIGGTVISSEYKGIESGGSALPLLGYEGNWLYLRGLSGGLHIFKNDFHEFNIQLSYLPQHFYAGWSDNSRMKRLDDRYSSLLAGLDYRLNTAYGVGQLSLSGDALGYSRGIVADASYSYPLRLNMVSMAPTVGVQWTDVNYNDYYYGVDASEARASGLRSYSPESSFSPYGGLAARMLLNENWSIFASGQLMFLGSEIQDSPMVDKSTKYSLSGGFLYNF